MSDQPSRNRENLNIFYVGGNGGFFLLHLLLLSQEYACELEQPKLGSFDSWFKHFKECIYPLQWDVNDGWKNNENWPDNMKTLLQENYGKPKIFFTCNEFNRWKNFPGKKVIIYTDIRTELRMSLFKQANHFLKSKFVDGIITKTIAVKGIRTVLRNPLEIYNNIEHRKGTQNMLDQSDIRINLQELIKNPEKVLFDNFGLTLNEDQRNHIANWLSLHPKKLLQKINLA
jgi:hypothetical protein